MKIIINHLAIEYSDLGKGLVILFLHGWQDNLRAFDPLIPFLPNFRVIRMDLPGFGNSEIPHIPWTLNDYVNLVKNFIKKLNINVNILIGHSFGGRIIIKGLAEKNIEAEKIVLIGSAGVSKTNTAKNFFFRLTAKIGKILILIPPFIFWKRQIRQKFYNKIGSDYLNAGALRDTFLNIVREDLIAAAKKITIPTLLIWGGQDKETPPEDGKKLHDLINESQLEIIPEAGHFAHRDNPELTADLIKKFILWKFKFLPLWQKKILKKVK